MFCGTAAEPLQNAHLQAAGGKGSDPGLTGTGRPFSSVPER
ncbi:hypothetical protein T261_02493 [Streptomyces lydicus]|nr:hypothetical protein T261_02493 [Streptomyces lydicus]